MRRRRVQKHVTIGAMLVVVILCVIWFYNKKDTPNVYPSYYEEKNAITYVLYGGHNSILNPQNLDDEMKYPIQLYPAKRDGFYFGGWYEDASFRKEITSVAKKCNMTIYARWTRNINNAWNIENYYYQVRKDENCFYLKDLPYGFLEKISIPGNMDTLLSDYQNHIIDSKEQCPQGLTFTDQYVVITSYAVNKKSLGTMAFFDKKTGEHIKTFGMEAKSHLGGITFDGENLWICHSMEREIQRISMNYLEKMIRSSKESFIDISGCFSRYSVDIVPSGIYYYKGQLYVSNHRTLGCGRMKSYIYDKAKDALQKKETYIIPSKTQGVCMDYHQRVYVSASYGRGKSSYLYIYQSLEEMTHHVRKPVYVIEMPPGSQQPFVELNTLYLIFETACSKYYEGTDGKGSADYPIDQILRLPLPMETYLKP